MYNIYTKLNREKEQQLFTRERMKILRHRRKQEATRNDMEKHYNNRVASFIHQMKEEPIVVPNDHEDNWVFLRQFRDPYESNKNITNERFKFKDEVDWQSILSPLERLQSKSNQGATGQFLEKTGLSKCLLNREINSQQSYDESKPETFRDHRPEKDVGRPMYFSMAEKHHNKTLFYSRPPPMTHGNRYGKVESAQQLECNKLNRQKIQRNLSDEIEDRKSSILSHTLKHRPKTKTQSRMNSTFCSFRTQRPKPSIEVREQFTIGKKKIHKTYFKDVQSIANRPNHSLSKDATDVMYACNLYNYKNNFV